MHGTDEVVAHDAGHGAEPVTIPLPRLQTFVEGVLVQMGMAAEHAHTVATVMVDADRYGISSHGTTKLAAYVERVDSGAMAVDPTMTIVRELRGSAVLDAQNGFGQLAATRAMRMALEKARDTGIASVGVTRSNHFGIAGHFARLATEAGFIGIAMTNASPALAPFNAKQKLFGTNPIAFGVPAGSRPAVVLDMSSSVVARGRIRREIDSGAASIPESWANDIDGRPTSDPERALGGTLSPVGGAKGAGLALVIDMLTGMLVSGAATGGVANLFDTSRAAGTAHLLIAIDPDAFVGREALAVAADETLTLIERQEPVVGDRVYYPGLIEHVRSVEIDRIGAPLTPNAIDGLERLARRFDVPLH